MASSLTGQVVQYFVHEEVKELQQAILSMQEITKKVRFGPAVIKFFIRELVQKEKFGCPALIITVTGSKA